MPPSKSKTQRGFPNEVFHLTVKNIPCLCYIGIHPYERTNMQPIFVSSYLWGNFYKTAVTGDLSKGVDYSILQNDYQTILRAGKFRLLESATFALCQWSLWRFTSLTQVAVSIKKPNALNGNGTPEIRCSLKKSKYSSERIVKTPDIEIVSAQFANKNELNKDFKSIELTDGTIVFARFQQNPLS